MFLHEWLSQIVPNSLDVSCVLLGSYATGWHRLATSLLRKNTVSLDFILFVCAIVHTKVGHTTYKVNKVQYTICYETPLLLGVRGPQRRVRESGLVN